MRTKALVLGAALQAAALHAAPAAPAWVPARPRRYVTDTTGRLDDVRLSALNEKLAAVDRRTTHQVLVYVASRLPADVTLEEFANRCLHAWGPGTKERDNGVLFVVFLDQRVMRIEVGYGLEGDLPDARARQITGDVVKPRFKAGDYVGGIETGTAAIVAAVHGGPMGAATTPAPRAASPAARPFEYDPNVVRLVTGVLALVLGLAAAWITALFRRDHGHGDALPTGLGAGLTAAGAVGAIGGLITATSVIARLGFAALGVGGLLLWTPRTIAQWRAAATEPPLARLSRRLALALRLLALGSVAFLAWPPTVGAAAAVWCAAAALMSHAVANAIGLRGEARVRGIVFPLVDLGTLALAAQAVQLLAAGAPAIVMVVLAASCAMVSFIARLVPAGTAWQFPTGRPLWVDGDGFQGGGSAPVPGQWNTSSTGSTTSTPDWSSSSSDSGSSGSSSSDYSGGGGDSGGGGSSDSW